MKPFRLILTAALVSLGVLSVTLYTSCKNKCGSTTCQNGGTCADNICECPTGYSGNACQTSWSGVVIGTYTCSRSDCKPAVTGPNSWQSSITVDATNGGFTVDVSNFDNSGITQVATVDSNINGITHIVISQLAGAYGVEATGTYENGIINLQFTSAGAGGVSGYSCNMILKKE